MALLGLALSLVSLVCGIIIIIDAFNDEVWKGIVALLFWPYLLYYAFAEFEHEKKVLILTLLLASSLLSVGVRFL